MCKIKTGHWSLFELGKEKDERQSGGEAREPEGEEEGDPLRCEREASVTAALSDLFFRGREKTLKVRGRSPLRCVSAKRIQRGETQDPGCGPGACPA